MNNNCITYHIDEKDCISFISNDWYYFAEQNQAPHLTSDAVMKHSLYSFIHDYDCQLIYSMLIRNVRENSKSVDFPFRCDSPSVRRFMNMKVFPLKDDYVGFKSCILREEAREPSRLLDINSKKSDSILKICSWCKKVDINTSNWIEIEDAFLQLNLFDSTELPQLSHGMCPSCLDEFRRNI